MIIGPGPCETNSRLAACQVGLQLLPFQSGKGYNSGLTTTF